MLGGGLGGFTIEFSFSGMKRLLAQGNQPDLPLAMWGEHGEVGLLCPALGVLRPAGALLDGLWDMSGSPLS